MSVILDHVEHTTCPLCQKTNEIEVNMHDYLAWQNGLVIQSAMPYLSASEREMLITGICDDCWKESFGDLE